MKKFLLIMLLLCGVFTNEAFAQKLYVYEVVGEVKLIKEKIASDITVRQELSLKSIINMKKGSKLILIDTEEKKKYTLKEAGTSSIENIIKKSSQSITQLNDVYMKFIKKQIFGTGVLTSKKAVDGGYASIERGDSIDDIEIPDSIINDDDD